MRCATHRSRCRIAATTFLWVVCGAPQTNNFVQDLAASCYLQYNRGKTRKPENLSGGRPGGRRPDDGLLLAPSCPAQSTAAVSVHGLVTNNPMDGTHGGQQCPWQSRSPDQKNKPSSRYPTLITNYNLARSTPRRLTMAAATAPLAAADDHARRRIDVKRIKL